MRRKQGVAATTIQATSFEDLASHRPWMFTRAYRYATNRHDAEEAVQESFLRYLQRAPANVTNPKAYLSRILDNVLHGSKRGFNRFEVVVDDLTSFDTELRTLVPHRAYEEKERQSQIRECLATLKPRHQRVLLLLAEGLTPREIAPIFGISSHAVNALQIRAKLNLRLALMKKGLVPVFVPFSTLRARLSSWMEISRLQPGDALALIAASVLVPIAVAVLPIRPAPPAAEPSRPITANGHSDRSADQFLAPNIQSDRDPAIKHSHASTKESVTHLEGPSTSVDVEGEQREGPPEPSLQDQLLAYVVGDITS